MFHSFPVLEQEMEETWRRKEDPRTRINKKLDYLIEQVKMMLIERDIDQLKDQVENFQNMRRAELKDVQRENQYFGNLINSDGPFDFQMDRSSFVWRESEVQDMTAVPDGSFDLQTDRLDFNREAYNSGFSDYSSFALNDQCLVSQPDPGSTFFSETSNFLSPTEWSSFEKRFQIFKMNQIKFNEEVSKDIKSLTSDMNTLIAHYQKMPETKNSSYRQQDEQNDEMTLCSDCEFESFSSKKTEIWLETNKTESIQVESREEQEKIEEPKYIPPPPYIPPIPFPQRLFRAEIVKSNELELKHPPIDPMNDETEEEEDGDTILKVEASDKKNDEFTEVDLSNPPRRCLEKSDVTEGDKPQIKYHIIIEPYKMTSKEEHSKHISRNPLKHFWKNYDALRGRKVKIR